MTSTIQLNEYIIEVMVRDLLMKYVMMATHYQMMDEIRIELKSRIHGYALEEVKLHKTVVSSNILDMKIQVLPLAIMDHNMNQLLAL